MSRSSIDPWTRASAKRMRREPTEAERRLWGRLRGLNRAGAGFRRQVPIGPYVADFAWLSARLIVELDGGQHAEETKDRDAVRDAWLRERGFRVLRFWNADVVESLDGVVEAIFQECRDSLPGPHPTRPMGGPPSPRGGGRGGGEAGDTHSASDETKGPVRR
ncbi:MAG: endonuclease domain-containing protein [Phyllobacteriaceae bacterium]|nr:endonuclease domain-containing protein [Phyllobacteriaceae bacterium]